MFWDLLNYLNNFDFLCFLQFVHSILTSFWGHFLLFWDSNGLFLGWGEGSNTVCGSTHVVEQLSFLTFWGPNGLLLGLGWGSTTVLGSTYVVEQLSSSLFLSIRTFDFDLILWSFFSFWGPNGLFLGLGKGSNTVLGSTHVVEKLLFFMIP